MSQPVRATIEEARIAPIPPGFRSSLLMQHGSMKLRYYKPRGPDLQTPHDQDELYVIASGRGTFLMVSVAMCPPPDSRMVPFRYQPTARSILGSR